MKTQPDKFYLDNVINVTVAEVKVNVSLRWK